MNKSFSHERVATGKEEWLTPPDVLAALAPFDLDPCAPLSPPWKIAETEYTIADNGLTKPWSGFVWCNPPYGNKTGDWLARMADHNNGIALVFARTETRMFFDHVWPVATAVFFIKGRLNFYHANGSRGDAAGAPSVLIAYGEDGAKRLMGCGIEGRFIRLISEVCA